MYSLKIFFLKKWRNGIKSKRAIKRKRIKLKIIKE